MTKVHQIVPTLPRQFDVSHAIVSVSALLRLWDHRWTSRRELRDLDQRALDDLGLTREQARAEAAKPFWEA